MRSPMQSICAILLQNGVINQESADLYIEAEKITLIEAYRDGFNEELPFINGDKWYEDKFKNEDND